MSDTDITVRAAVSQDAAALTSLVYRSKQSNGYDDAFMALCVDVLRVTPDLIARDRYFVAMCAEQISGCAALALHNDGSAEIHAFFIAPEYKRRGVGSRLWQTALTTAQSEGVTHLCLDADPFAVDFYQKLGFRILHDTPSDAIPGRMIPHMVREI